MNRANATETVLKLRDGEKKDFTEIAEVMNKKGLKTKTGKAWNVANVRYVYHTSKITERAGKRTQSGGKPKSDPNAVNLILQLYEANTTPAAISEALTVNGFKTATGVPWNKDNVRKLIQVYRKNPPPALRALSGGGHRKGPKRIAEEIIATGRLPEGFQSLQQELSVMFERFDKAGIHIGAINRDVKGGQIAVTYLAPRTESFAPVAVKAVA